MPIAANIQHDDYFDVSNHARVLENDDGAKSTTGNSP